MIITIKSNFETKKIEKIDEKMLKKGTYMLL